MRDEDLVPEEAIDYDEIFPRGGENCGDEDFTLFKCPACGRVYLIDYEVDTVYLDPKDLSRRNEAHGPIMCEGCGVQMPDDEAWIGPKANPKSHVSWRDLESSGWSWVARRSREA